MVIFVKINIDWSQQAVGQASICFCSSKMQLPQGKAYTISYYLCPIPPTHQKQVSLNQLPELETCSPRQGLMVEIVNINIATSPALGKLSGQDSLHKRNDRPTRLTLDSSGLPYFGHPLTPEAAAEVWLRIAASGLET